MKRSCSLLAVWLSFSKTVIIALSVYAASSATNAIADEALIALGRDLYFGTQHFQQSPQVAGVSLPASQAACVHCHGALGQGAREGAQQAPEIRGKAQDWLKAALLGQRSDGTPTQHNMPRYVMTLREQAALSAYAPLLGTANDPVRGVAENHILFGLYANNQHNMLAIDNILSGVEQSFARVNASGGVHGRQLKVRLVSSLEESQEVFALLAGIAPMHGLQAARLPHVANLNLQTQATSEDKRWSMPLLPSFAAQQDLLLQTLSDAAAAGQCRVLLIESPQAQASRAQPLAVKAHRIHSQDDIQQLARDEKQPYCVGVTASASTALPLLKAMHERNLTIHRVVTLAVMGMPADAVPWQAMQEQILPTPVAALQAAQLERQSHWFMLGAAAGQAVIEALARSGRLLQPELLLEKMQSLTGYAPLANAPLQWSRTQAHGWQASRIVLPPPVATTAATQGNALNQQASNINSVDITTTTRSVAATGSTAATMTEGARP